MAKEKMNRGSKLVLAYASGFFIMIGGFLSDTSALVGAGVVVMGIFILLYLFQDAIWRKDNKDLPP